MQSVFIDICAVRWVPDDQCFTKPPIFSVGIIASPTVLTTDAASLFPCIDAHRNITGHGKTTGALQEYLPPTRDASLKYTEN